MRSGAKQALAVLLGSQELHQERRATELEGKVSEFFLLFKLPIYRYLLGQLGNRDDAEEMMQEVFLSLYGTLQKGTRIDNVRAWVFRVAHNLAVNQQKRPRIIEALDEDQWWKLCQERSDPASRQRTAPVARGETDPRDQGHEIVCRRRSAIVSTCAPRGCVLGKLPKCWGFVFPASKPFWIGASGKLPEKLMTRRTWWARKHWHPSETRPSAFCQRRRGHGTGTQCPRPFGRMLVLLVETRSDGRSHCCLHARTRKRVGDRRAFGNRRPEVRVEVAPCGAANRDYARPSRRSRRGRWLGVPLPAVVAFSLMAVLAAFVWLRFGSVPSVSAREILSRAEHAEAGRIGALSLSPSFINSFKSRG